MYETEAYKKFNRFAHGYVYVPLWLKLGTVFEHLRLGQPVPFAQLCKAASANAGPLKIALNSLNGFGYLEVDGDVVIGRAGLEAIRRLPGELLELFRMDPVTYLTSSASAIYAPYFESMKSGWSDIGASSLSDFLDGIVVLPLVIGLHQWKNGEVESGNKIALNGLPAHVVEELAFVFEYLRLGVLDAAGECIVLEEEGQWVYSKALNYALSVSYRPLLTRLHELFFGNVASVFEYTENHEGHIDRTLNVQSSGSMHHSYFKAIVPQILALFNGSNLADQPRYIVDTGCGDGTFLAQVYREIVARTERGKHLERFPLMVVGVDFNDAALVETKAQLEKLDIPHVVVHGDIGDPGAILASLEATGVDLSKRLLHIRSFLDHDRPYQSPSKRVPECGDAGDSSQYMSIDGKEIKGSDVVRSLAEHLHRWQVALKPEDDLMVLEVHSLAPDRAYRDRDTSISLHFDLLQALSGQMLVSAEAFYVAAGIAGLQIATPVRFPAHQAHTRITFTHFRKSPYRIRPMVEGDLDIARLLAACNRVQDPEVLASWLLEEVRHTSLRDFVLERLDSGAEGPDQADAAIYSQNQEGGGDIPGRFTGHTRGSGESVHIVDIHTAPEAGDNVRGLLFEFLMNLLHISGLTQGVTYKFRSLAAQREPAARQLLEDLRRRKDIELLETPRYQAEAVRCQGACSGHWSLVVRYGVQGNTPKLGQETKPTREGVIHFLHQEVNRLTDGPVMKEIDRTLLSYGLDSLELGGIARRLSSFIGSKVSLPTLFKSQTIAQLVDQLLDISSQKGISIEVGVASVASEHQISLAQEPLWIWFEHIGGTSAYNVPRIEHFKGSFSPELYLTALKTVLARHSNLRTSYRTGEAGPVVTVAEPAEITPIVEIADLRADADGRKTARREIERNINKPFDLESGEVMRSLILQIDEEEWVVAITMHHIITDGSSIPIFWHELVSAYRALIRGSDSKLPELKRQYLDWAEWQRKSYEAGLFQAQVGYWARRLQGELPLLDLPVDYPMPKFQTFNGHRLSISLPTAEYAKLARIAGDQDVSMFVAIVAAWAAFLGRHCRQSEVIVGTPWANREQDEVQPLIGCFVNTLPLRIPIQEQDGFTQLLREVKATALEAFENASIPFHKVVEQLQIKAPPGRLPVYQTMVALEEENGWVRGAAFEGTERIEGDDRISAIRDTSKFEISLSVREKAGAKGKWLDGEFVYNTDLFSPETAELMRQRFLHFLKGVVAEPTRNLCEIDLVPPEERSVLDGLNDTCTEFAIEQTVIQMIDQQSTKSPHNIALRCGSDQLSYSQLSKLVHAFSHHLVDCGIENASLVGLCMERTPALVVAILSLMQLGCPFVPIDLSYPDERKRYIVEDSGVGLVLATNVEDVPEGVPTMACDDSMLAELPRVTCDRKPSGSDLAYVLYTSGTTGRPKGVRITHANLLNDVQHMTERQFQRRDFDLVLFSTNIVFDQFVEELFPALCVGGAVLLVDTLLDESWKGELVTLVVTTPSLMNAALSERIPDSVRSVVLGGEDFNSKLIDRLFGMSGVERVYNSYGPTECTDQATVGLITRESRRISLGQPISNVTTYVLGDLLQVVPIGVWGELYIGGSGVGGGYHNRDELTNERFISNPFGQGRLYRTGDVVRWSYRRDLEFRGRDDDQVKINGVRVEKREVEAALRRVDGIQDVFVAVQRGQGEQQLVAYVTPESVSVDQAMAKCRETLSPHMLPKHIVTLEKLPLLRAGKVDVHSLPEPTATPRELTQSVDEFGPSDALTAGIISMYRALLGTSQVVGSTEFLRSGGHSLLVVKLLVQIRREYGVRLRMRDILENDTPIGVAQRLRDLDVGADEPASGVSSVVTVNPDSVPVGGSSILIIGCGVAGMMAAIECAKRGINCRIVDKAERCGGIWLHGCNKQSKLQTASTYYTVDSVADHKNLYPDRAQMLSHLQAIFSAHTLERCTSFGVEVSAVRHQGDLLAVDERDVVSGDIETRSYDGILVCAGKHSIPHVPSWHVCDGSPPVVHAAKLDGHSFRGQDVVVIGAGSYAIEALRIAYQDGARSVTMVARKSYWVLPTLADTILYSGIHDDLSFGADYAGRAASLESWLTAYYKQFGIEHMIPRPRERAFDVHISTSDEFFQIIQNDHISLRIGEVKELRSTSVQLKDGVELAADIVVAATGYADPDLSFLNPISANMPTVYKGYMLTADPRIGFVGFLDMVLSATAVIPLNLELAIGAMRSAQHRPTEARVRDWVESMPEDLVRNIKAHSLWLREEKMELDAEQLIEAVVRRWAREAPAAVALESGAVSLSFGELYASAQRTAKGLQTRSAKMVLAVLPESIESIVVILGALLSRTKLYVAASDKDLTPLLKQIGDIPDVVFCPAGLRDSIATALEPTSSATIVVIESPGGQQSSDIPSLAKFGVRGSLEVRSEAANYEVVFWTSGSTGSPKGVRHSYGSIYAALKGFEETCFGDRGGCSRLLFMNRLSHFGGFMSAFSTLQRGGTVVLGDSTDAVTVDTIARTGPNLLIMMSSQAVKLFEQAPANDPRWQCLQHVVVGGEALLPSEEKRLRKRSPASVTFTFGISECGPLFRRDADSSCPRHLGDELDGVEYRLLRADGTAAGEGEVGQLAVRSPAQALGYIETEAGSSRMLNQSGFFESGDYVLCGPNGRLVYKGRDCDRVAGDLFSSDLEELLVTELGIPQAIVSVESQGTNPAISVQVPDENAGLVDLGQLEEVVGRRLCRFDLEIRMEKGSPSSTYSGKRQKGSRKGTDSSPSRPKVLLFPGQGSQHVGMVSKTRCSDAGKALFGRASEILGYDLLKLCSDGPQDRLDRTEAAQVAIYVTSMARLHDHLERDPSYLSDCRLALGLSLGEFSALTAARCLEFEDGVRVLQLRGQLMQRASDACPQAMISVIGLPEEEVAALLGSGCSRGQVYLANKLHPTQFVIAGTREECESVGAAAEEAGAICMRLAVSGAFHTRYMDSAAGELRSAIQGVNFGDPFFAVVSNVDGKASTDPEGLREKLILQVNHSVELVTALRLLRSDGLGINDCCELGPGRTLSKLVGRYLGAAAKNTGILS